MPNWSKLNADKTLSGRLLYVYYELLNCYVKIGVPLAKKTKKKNLGSKSSFPVSNLNLDFIALNLADAHLLC